jgi:hypothetical protein
MLTVTELLGCGQNAIESWDNLAVEYNTNINLQLCMETMNITPEEAKNDCYSLECVENQRSLGLELLRLDAEAQIYISNPNITIELHTELDKLRRDIYRRLSLNWRKLY